MLGDFWSCIRRGDESFSMESRVGDMAAYEVVGSTRVPVFNSSVNGGVVLMEHSGVSFDTLLWLSENDRGLELVSVYPYLRDAAVFELDVAGVREWENNIEGLVYGKIENYSLAFFDALFPLSRESYTNGETIKVCLSGLGKSVYKLSVLAEATNGRDSDSVQDAIVHVLSTGESKLLSFHHIPARENIDDCMFLFGKVLEHSVTESHGTRVHRISIAMLGGVAIPIVFGEDSIDTPNWQPEAGQFVGTIFFLQGYRLAYQTQKREIVGAD